MKRAAALLLVLPALATAATDTYGGRTDIACAGGVKPHFYVEKINQRWWFCTPLGHAFFENKPSNIVASGGDAQSAGPQGKTYNSVVLAKYGSANNYGNWSQATVARMNAWGFNTAGEYSDWYMWGTNAQGTLHVPYEPVLRIMPYALVNRGNLVPSAPKVLMNGIDQTYENPNLYKLVADMFDPALPVYYQAIITGDAAGINSARNDPWMAQIEVDDRDSFWGWGPGPQNSYSAPSIHVGWLTLIDAPTRYWYADAGLVYPDPKLYSKLGLRDYLESVYQTGGLPDLAKLNSAWGSAYTTWDSSGTQRTEGLCAGQWDGVRTSCVMTLAAPAVGKDSVGVRINGIVVGGDNINGQLPSTGVLGGALTGTVTYATGALAVTFTAPPATGAAVTVEYVSGGFSFGSGLLDEAGQHPWVCKDYIAMIGCANAMATDLNGFLYRYAKQYTSMVKTLMATNYPGILNACMGVLSNPDGGRTRDEIIRATAEDCDIVYASVGSDASGAEPNAMAAQAMLDATYAAMGPVKRPLLPQRELVANGDSPFSAYPCVAGSYICAASQAARGQAYYDWMAWEVNAKDTLTGDHPFVGVQFWSWMDKPNEHQNFGAISNIDNAYDGHEAVSSKVTCSAPLAAYSCGGEATSYGDAVTRMTQANALWLAVPAGGGTPPTPTPPPMVSIASTVHYVQKRPASLGGTLVHLPAVVVSVGANTYINLQVFTDGTNSETTTSKSPTPPNVKWQTSVGYDSTAQTTNSWHWPE